MKEKRLSYRVIAFWLFIGSIVLWYILSFQMKDYKFGLDLNGGTSLTYIADITKINEINKEAENSTTSVSTTTGQKITSIETSKLKIDDSMNGLRDVIEKRINAFGVSESIVRTEYSKYSDEYRLIVELPGITNLDDAIKMIGDTPILEFKIIETDEKNGTSTQKLIDTGLNGNYLRKSILSFDQLTNKPQVVISFNEEGKKLFAQITKDNIGKQIAIFLDGEVISSPTVQQEITGGDATISGGFSVEEAKTLVKRLNSGALPLPIKLSSSQIVEATLGSQAKADGILAGELSLLIIIILMIIWYRLPGLLASIALISYVGIVLFLFKSIPVVLTAAGIAGFIISIGIAIDANILIFERLKEEEAMGKKLEEATEEGFKRAWTSIRDSHIASILVSIILYNFGSTLLKGFGFVFGIGVIVSLFSSMIISKYFIRAFVPQNDSKYYKVMRFLFGSGFKK